MRTKEGNNQLTTVNLSASATRELANGILNHWLPYYGNAKRVRLILRRGERRRRSRSSFSEPFEKEVLRSAIVFQHAAMEELLRNIGIALFPSTDESALNRVPLSGSEDALRPEKFLLGRLAAHRGKSVKQLLAESVSEHFARRTFNSVTEIGGVLETIGVPLDDNIRVCFPEMQRLIERRHQIVHQADVARGKSRPAEITLSDVKLMCAVTNHFCTYVTQLVLMRVAPRSAHAWVQVGRLKDRMITQRAEAGERARA